MLCSKHKRSVKHAGDLHTTRNAQLHERSGELAPARCATRGMHPPRWKMQLRKWGERGRKAAGVSSGLAVTREASASAPGCKPRRWPQDYSAPVSGIRRLVWNRSAMRQQGQRLSKISAGGAVGSEDLFLL